MGYLIIMMIVLSVFGLLLGWLNYKISKLKEDNELSIETISSIIALEKAMKKLNRALRSHDRRLDNHLHEISDIKNRLDILESGHPDTDIDYGTVDDDGNIIEVWFEGKRYVPEDKRVENTIILYADNKVVAETTRPDVKCCATCKHYWPGVNHTCNMNPFMWVSSKNAACNKYEEASKPVEYIRYDRMYKNLDGNGETEQLIKKIADLNYFYNVSLMSAATYMHRWKELMRDDT